jgi:hypothetical protein
MSSVTNNALTAVATQFQEVGDLLTRLLNGEDVAKEANAAFTNLQQQVTREVAAHQKTAAALAQASLRIENQAQGFSPMPAATVKNVVSTLKNSFFAHPKGLSQDDKQLLLGTLTNYVDDANVKYNPVGKRIARLEGELKITAKTIEQYLIDYRETFWSHKILVHVNAKKQAHRDKAPERKRAALKAKQDYKALVANAKAARRAEREKAREDSVQPVLSALSFLDLEADEM